MKHLFIALTISAASFFNTAKAKDPVTPPVLESFRSTYTHAQEVHWSEIGTGFKATFKLDGEYATAYYLSDGNWIGTTKNISTSELSPKLRANLKRELKEAWVSDLYVMSTNEGEVYFATVESADNKKVLKSNNGRKWDHYKSIKK
ncbi:MAG TPA: hypothetical protein VD794_04950 [Flavisolibacter sp.]|nr:hypothetical protein [Flavisolibacter sp.]